MPYHTRLSNQEEMTWGWDGGVGFGYGGSQATYYGSSQRTDHVTPWDPSPHTNNMFNTMHSKTAWDSPKAIFLTEKATAITQWQTEGDLVIVMVDMNEDVGTPAIQNMFCLIGLVNGPAYQYPQLLATHN